MCSCGWRLENKHRCYSSGAINLFFETGPAMDLGLCQVGRLTGDALQGSTCLHLPSHHCLDYKHKADNTPSFLRWFWGPEPRSTGLQGKLFTAWAISCFCFLLSLSLNHHWLYSYRVHHHHSPCREIRPLITPPLPCRRWPSTLSFQATEATVGKPSSPTLAWHTTQGVLTASEGRTRRWMHAFILAGGVAHSPPHLGPEEVRQYRQVWLWKA